VNFFGVKFHFSQKTGSKNGKDIFKRTHFFSQKIIGSKIGVGHFLENTLFRLKIGSKNGEDLFLFGEYTFLAKIRQNCRFLDEKCYLL